jgi:hypothetical protein
VCRRMAAVGRGAGRGGGRGQGCRHVWAAAAAARASLAPVFQARGGSGPAGVTKTPFAKYRRCLTQPRRRTRCRGPPRVAGPGILGHRRPQCFSPALLGPGKACTAVLGHTATRAHEAGITCEGPAGRDPHLITSGLTKEVLQPGWAALAGPLRPAAGCRPSTSAGLSVRAHPTKGPLPGAGQRL